MAEEKKNTSVVSEEGDVREIDYTSLASSSLDEESKITTNKFLLSLRRNLISLKNHVSTIPFLMVIATMVFVTFSSHANNQAASVSLESASGILLFCDTLAAILSVLCYLNVQGKHTEKKKVIMFSVFFYVLMVVQLVIEYHLVHEYTVEMQVANGGVTSETGVAFLTDSRRLFNIHIVLIYISMALAAIAPIVQPFTKKIHF